jgi:hypothetical protein
MRDRYDSRQRGRPRYPLQAARCLWTYCTEKSVRLLRKGRHGALGRQFGEILLRPAAGKGLPLTQPRSPSINTLLPGTEPNVCKTSSPWLDRVASTVSAVARTWVRGAPSAMNTPTNALADGKRRITPSQESPLHIATAIERAARLTHNLGNLKVDARMERQARHGALSGVELPDSTNI